MSFYQTNPNADRFFIAADTGYWYRIVLGNLTPRVFTEDYVMMTPAMYDAGMKPRDNGTLMTNGAFDTIMFFAKSGFVVFEVENSGGFVNYVAIRLTQLKVTSHG